MHDSPLACPHCRTSLASETRLKDGTVYCPACGAKLDVLDTPHADDQWWMLGEDQREYGPVPRNVLDRWFSEGRVSAQCQLRAGSNGEYVPASSIYPSLGSMLQPPLRPASLAPTGRRTWVAAFILAFIGPFTGFCGLHRFYLGHIGLGVLQLLTLGGCMIWQIIDIVILASGGMRDADGRPLE